jgi:hypothetical protein
VSFPVYDSVCNSSCVLFAEDFKFIHNIRHFEDCKHLQFDIDTVQKWFWDDGREVNVDRTTFVFVLARQTVYPSLVNCTVLVITRYQCVKDIGSFLDTVTSFP